MSKINLIISREYLTRVRKKSFIIMTILGPILMAALIIAPVLLTMLDDNETKTIAVVDRSNEFKNVFENSESLKFVYLPTDSIESIKSNFTSLSYYALLVLPQNIENNDVELLSDVQPDITTKRTIKKDIEKKIRSDKLVEFGINESKLDSAITNVNVRTIKIQSDGTEDVSSTEVIMAIGMVAGFIIYMFIFMYGAQVMRGVLEEKTNRVVEVLVSSVKPFQLMMGKVIGIALVALTQVALWIVLTFAIVSVVNPMINSTTASKQEMISNTITGNNVTADSLEVSKFSSNEGINEALKTFTNLPILQILFSFIFYFLGGYLLYASLFAAIGGAVDNETDTQQFMMPITVPLILAIVVAQAVIKNPDGALAFWFSIIPFTSPIVMLLRVPFGVPAWELILSMVLLVLTFVGTIWLAGKIYRVGILMYGKKITYKELWKWLKY